MPDTSPLFRVYRWCRTPVDRCLRGIARSCDRVLMRESVWHGRLPRSLARRLGSICIALAQSPRLAAFRLTGPSWTIVFVGIEASRLNIERLFFPDGCDTTPVRPVFRTAARGRVRAWLDEGVNLVIYEQVGRVRSPGFDEPITVTVPSWIDHVLTLPESIEDLMSGNRLRRRQLKKCEKAGYTAETTNDGTVFDDFYHKLYTPFVTGRHGGTALLTPYADLQRTMNLGELVVIRDGENLIAAKICYLRDGTWYNGDAGIDLSSPNYMKDGVTSFLDWHCFLRAKEKGAHTINMGGTRGWYSDGVYWYKNLWGAKVEERSRICSDWWLLGRNLSRELRELVNEKGFVVRENGMLLSLHVAEPTDPDPADLPKLIENAHKQGLRGLLSIGPSRQRRVHTDASSDHAS